MPHAVLQSPLGLDAIEAEYGRFQYSYDDCHINFMELFRAKDDDSLFVETYIKEEPVAQRLGLVIRQREPGNYVISLHELGFPRPTRGVQLAIGQLAIWLVSLNDETKILHHNLLPEALSTNLSEVH